VKIMIVDDHQAFRQLVKTLLAPLQATFAEVEDGQDAVRHYPAFRPDVVLMDLAMTVLDGLRATAQIKAQFPDARILILTQYDDADFRKAAQEAGASGYVLKEDASQLPALLRRLPQPA
jgi:two-component system, NarL family, response regulator DegU